MPQLWLTYEEMAQHLACNAEEARGASIAANWTRKRSHDGLTRVLMPPAMMHAYFSHAALSHLGLDRQADTMVEALRRVVDPPGQRGADDKVRAA